MIKLLVGKVNMSEHLNRAQRYQNGIKKILLHDWDPIGVSHIPEAQDEYDSYIGDVYSRLIHHVPKHDLFDFPKKIETAHMGLYGNRRQTEAIVDKLIALRKRMESS